MGMWAGGGAHVRDCNGYVTINPAVRGQMVGAIGKWIRASTQGIMASNNPATVW
jgi:hypothetical protein